MMRGYSSAWMFTDWPPKSLHNEGQSLNLAVLRLFVVALYKPIIRPLMRWMATR